VGWGLTQSINYTFKEREEYVYIEWTAMDIGTAVVKLKVEVSFRQQHT